MIYDAVLEGATLTDHRAGLLSLEVRSLAATNRELCAEVAQQIQFHRRVLAQQETGT